MSVRTRAIVRLAATTLAAACAHPAPVPIAPVAAPAAPTVAPHVATGSYDLTTTLRQSRPAAPPRRGRRPARPAPEVPATLQLSYQPLAALDPSASSGTQLAAVINLPGYTQAPRGRSGQAAIWWPLPGDSVVVHFAPPRAKGIMALRGALKGDTLSGDIWFTSTQSGSSYQVGTFTAVKKRT